MADPFPSLGGAETYAAPSAPKKGGAAANARPDVGSQDAFPALGGSAPAKPAAWVSHVPVIQRVTHQASVQLRLSEEQLTRLSQLLQRVQQRCPRVKIEASTTRKTNVTTFILKGPNEASVQAAKKELTALFARRVSLTVLVPASLRAYVIGAGGKNIKAITEETGVRIQIPPRAPGAAAPESDDPLADEQVEVTIEGDEVNAQQAQARLEALVAERTSKLTQRITDVDVLYYPFIAGARNAHAAHLAETVGRGEVSVHVPPRGALLAHDAGERARDVAIIVSGERDAVGAVASAIRAEAADFKAHFRTLTMTMPKRQHSLLVGEHAADVLASTGCAIELPSVHDASDTVTIRGPPQQLPHALTAALEKASAMSVQTLDLAAMHAADGEAHARHLVRWLAQRAPRTPSVQVYYPRENAPVVVEVVGTDATAVARHHAELEALARPVDASLVRVVELDPLAHGMVIGKKGQGLRTFEARGVDVLVPPESSGRSDVLLVLGRAEGVSRLPARGAERADAARGVLDGIAAELAQAGVAAADMRTEQVEVPAKFHGAVVGPDGTVLNAIIGEDRLMIIVGAARDARAKAYAPRALTEDSILVRGASEAVQRAVQQIQRIAADAEQDHIVNGHVEELSVAPQHVPHLIGRGGAGVAKLREELGVKIDIADADEKRKAPVPIRITGRRECAAEAKARLAAQAQRLADEQTVLITVPAEMYGVIIGQGGKYGTYRDSHSDAPPGQVRRAHPLPAGPPLLGGGPGERAREQKGRRRRPRRDPRAHRVRVGELAHRGAACPEQGRAAPPRPQRRDDQPAAPRHRRAGRPRAQGRRRKAAPARLARGRRCGARGRRGDCRAGRVRDDHHAADPRALPRHADRQRREAPPRDHHARRRARGLAHAGAVRALPAQHRGPGPGHGAWPAGARGQDRRGARGRGEAAHGPRRVRRRGPGCAPPPAHHPRRHAPERVADAAPGRHRPAALARVCRDRRACERRRARRCGRHAGREGDRPRGRGAHRPRRDPSAGRRGEVAQAARVRRAHRPGCVTPRQVWRGPIARSGYQIGWQRLHADVPQFPTTPAMPTASDAAAADSAVFAAPPDVGAVDAGTFASERDEVVRRDRRATRRAAPPASLDAQLRREPDMMSWSTHIDAVAEETPLVSLRAGPSRERRRTIALLVLYASIFVMALAMSLDSMSFHLYLNYACSEFNALSLMGTVIIVQQLVRAVSKPPVAKVIDLLGRIGTLLLVLALYAGGYAIMASANSFTTLLLGTVAQSLGSTGVQVLQSVIIADTTAVQWRGLLIATVNMPYLINFAVTGPFVDYILRTYGWRVGYAFWVVFVPLSAAPLLVTLFVGHRRARRRAQRHGAPAHPPLHGAPPNLLREMDLLGMGLFTSGLTLVLLPLSLGGGAAFARGWTGERAQLLTGCALLAVFAVWETRAATPFLPYRVLSNFTVVATCAIALLDFAGFYLSWTYLAPFIMILRDWDQLRTAYFVSTQNVTSTITGMLVGMLMAYTRRLKRFLTWGYVVRVLGVAMMIHFRALGHSAAMLVLCQVLQGVGGGSIAVTMQVAVQVAVPPARVAVVTAFELLTTEVGAAFGSALASALFTSQMRPALERHLPFLPPAEIDHIQGNLGAVLNYPLGTLERTAIAQAWVVVMRTLCIASLLVQLPAFVLTFCVPEQDLHDHTHRHRAAPDVEQGEQLAERAPSHAAPSTHIPSPPWCANRKAPACT